MLGAVPFRAGTAGGSLTGSTGNGRVNGSGASGCAGAMAATTSRPRSATRQ